MIFQKEYQSGWLPPSQAEGFGYIVSIVNLGVAIILQVVVWLALAAPPIRIFSTRRWKFIRNEKILTCALWIALVGHLAIYKVWNFYGGGLAIPLSVALIIMCCRGLFPLSKGTKFGNFTLAIIFATSLFSFPIRIFNIMPSLIATLHSNTDLLPGQPLSVSAFNFENTRTRVRLLASECGLPGDNSKRFVIDDMTYYAFDYLLQPIHLVYLYEGGFGADIGDNKLQQFLDKMGSDGIVAQCTYFPNRFLQNAKRDGNICCINLELMQNFSNIE